MRQTFIKFAPLGGAVLFLLATWGSFPAGAAPARPGPVVAEIGDSYGPAGPTEALWSVANRLRPDGAVTVQQMMMALLRANPDAFFHDNVNWLKRNQTLWLPTADDLQALSAREALLAIKAQNDQWRAAGGALPGVAPERLAAPSAALVEAGLAASPQPVATAEGDSERASAADADGDVAGLAAPVRSEGAEVSPGESAQGPSKSDSERASAVDADGEVAGLASTARSEGAEGSPGESAQEPAEGDSERASAADVDGEAAGLAPPARSEEAGGSPGESAQEPLKDAALPLAEGAKPAPAAEAQDPSPAKTAAKEQEENGAGEFAPDWLSDGVREPPVPSVLLAVLVLFLLLILWWFLTRKRSLAPEAEQPEDAPSQRAEATEAEDISRNKLDLAKAYSALGDKEQAKAALQEVLTEGNPAQQEEARALLAQLGQ